MSSLVSEAKYSAHERTEDYLEGFIFCNICQVEFAAGKVFKASPCSVFVLHSYTVGARTLQCKQVWLPLELNSQMLTLRLAEFQKTAGERMLLEVYFDHLNLRNFNFLLN